MTEHEFEMEMMNRFGVTLEEQLAACGVTIDEFFEDMERELAESENVYTWEDEYDNYWNYDYGYDEY